MSIVYAAYVGLTGGLLLACLLPFWLYTRLSGRYKKGLGERMGFVPSTVAQSLPGSPRIWVHAVSLGEVKVAASIVNALRKMIPGCSVIISTTTEHGKELARETFSKDTLVIYAPIDFIGCVRTAFSRVRPDVFVLLETEIWPTWIVEAKRMGIKSAMINGRISVTSINAYLKLRPFFRQILKNVDAFSMILEEDATRIRLMGADPRKIEVNGNAKYDLLSNMIDPAMEREMRQILNLGSSQRVLIAGSTRQGEEPMILDAYERILMAFPDTTLVIAPRHIDRTQVIATAVKERGFNCQLWSELKTEEKGRTAPVVIMDTFGELFKLYSVGTLVFCGASFVPLGGQNPLEAAIWGKVVFYGPHMENFLDAKGLLDRAGAGVPVSSPEELAQKAVWFLRHPDALAAQGKRAREAVLSNQKVAEKHAKVIAGLLTNY